MAARVPFPVNSTAQQQLEYVDGYAVGQLDPQGGEFDNRGRFFVLGQRDARAGFPPWYVRGADGRPVANPQVGGTQGGGTAQSTPATLPTQGSREDFRAYVEGYQAPALPDQTARGIWFVAGQQDRRANVPPRFVQLAGNVWGPNPQASGANGSNTGLVQKTADGRTVVLPPPPLRPGEQPSPVMGPYYPPRQPPVYLPPPPLPPPGPVGPLPGYGTVRYCEVFFSILGKRVPWELGAAIERATDGNLLTVGLQLGTTAEILGTDPDDARRGFKISGPSGPLMFKVAQAIGRRELPPYPWQVPPPLGPLPAWYGAKTREGIRLLWRPELDALGLSDRLV